MDSAILGNIRLIFIGLFVVLWLYWLWTRKDIYKYFFNSRVVWGLPFFGIIGTHMRNPYDFLPCMKSLLEKGDYMVGTWLGLNPVILLAEPEIIEKVLTSPDFLNKASIIYTSLNNALGPGIITSEANIWKQHRKLINPAFNHPTLLSFFSIFEAVKRKTIQQFNELDDGGQHAIYELLQNETFDISLATTMGTNYEALDYKNTKHHLNEAFKYAINTTTIRGYFDLLKLGWIFDLNPKYQMKVRHLKQLVNKIMQSKMNTINIETTAKCEKFSTEALNECDSIKKNPKIFVDQIMQIIQNTDIDSRTLINEAHHIVAASFETSANTIYSFITLLAMHSDIQARLFEEIFSFYPDKDFNMEYEHMQHLPYLDMVINEVLRLTPSIPIIGRRVIKDTQVTKDVTLPKNLDVIIPTIILHRRTDIWGPDANNFNPDNFLPENIKGKHPYAFIPFSKGARGCIGWRYAFFFMRIFGSGLVRNFKFSTDFRYEDLAFTENISLKYKHYPKIRIEKR